MVSSTIYQNESGTITLLDLPKSIESGQSPLGSQPLDQQSQRVLSTRPLEQAYPSTEPRHSKRARLRQSIPLLEQEYHVRIQGLVLQSLQEIRSALNGRPWCLPRQYPTAYLEEEVIPYTSSSDINQASLNPPVILSPISNVFTSFREIQDHVFYNPSSQRVQLVVGCQTYQIPAHCAFLLSDVRRSDAMSCSLSQTMLPKTFDLILMDPPWENRSARRANAYSLDSQDPFLSVLPVVQTHLKDKGVVGIWVTNKASIRQLALRSLYQEDLHLWEEWIWLKTTLSGEPVTPLDGLWRRPYETLLLFSRLEEPSTKISDDFKAADAFKWDDAVTRRSFVAVPDAHSRKPCLKEYMGPLLFKSRPYQALEIFARITTAGWFGWGDQVLKFNERSHWTKDLG